jgi:hypothetical protein
MIVPYLCLGVFGRLEGDSGDFGASALLLVPGL